MNPTPNTSPETSPDTQPSLQPVSTQEAKVAAPESIETSSEPQASGPKYDINSIYPVPGQLRSQSGSESVSGVSQTKAESKQSYGAAANIVRVFIGVCVIISPIVSTLIIYWIYGLYYGGTHAQLYGIENFGTMLEASWKAIFSYGSSQVTLLSGVIGASPLTMALIHVVLGVGIILKKEIARVALIGLMVIGVVSSFYSIVMYSQTTKAQTATFGPATMDNRDLHNGAAYAQQQDQQRQRMAEQELYRQQAQSTTDDRARSQRVQPTQSTKPLFGQQTNVAMERKKKEEPLIPLHVAIPMVGIVINILTIAALSIPAVRRQFTLF